MSVETLESMSILPARVTSNPIVMSSPSHSGLYKADDIISQLDITGCKLVSVSPNKPNIFYRVERRSGDAEKDLAFLVDDLAKNSISSCTAIL